MNDLLSVFDSDDPEPPDNQPLLMTGRQREQIRGLFAQLGIGSAREQFDLTAQLTGVRIGSVADLEATSAQRLIEALQRRIDSTGRTRTGNVWVDRDEDTWIDRL